MGKTNNKNAGKGDKPRNCFSKKFKKITIKSIGGKIKSLQIDKFFTKNREAATISL